jgi:hypothetical protein
MKRLILIAFLSLFLMSFSKPKEYNFPREMWKPVNTALGFYYALVIPEYNYIAWDLISSDWKDFQGLKRETFAEDCNGYPLENTRVVVDIEAGVYMPPDYYKVVLVFNDFTGMTLCVRNDHNHWEIDCIWSE